MGELEISELVVAVIIADMISIPLQDIGIPMINGLIPLIILLCCEILITGIAAKSIKLRLFLFGKPSILIDKGQINQKEMKTNRFTLDELFEELRQQGITDISKVERAILETNGKLNVILYPEELPPTCKQMGIPSASGAIPILLINEGHILHDNLTKIGKDIHWLTNYLNNRHIQTPTDIYLLSYDESGKYHTVLMEK